MSDIHPDDFLTMTEYDECMAEVLERQREEAEERMLDDLYCEDDE